MPSEPSSSCCFPFFRRNHKPNPPHTKTRRLSIRFGGKEQEDYSQCIGELESLLSAAELRAVRIVFGYLAVSENGEGWEGKIPGLHTAWDAWDGKEGVNWEAIETYLGLPPSLSHTLRASFLDHPSHFHASPPAAWDSSISYHAFLHTVVSIALLDPGEQRSLVPVLDLFAHGVARAGKGEEREPDSAETATSESNEHQSIRLSDDPKFDPFAFPCSEAQGSDPHLFPPLASRRTVPPAGRRKSRTILVTHTDKSIPSSSEDEKLSLTHADLSSLLANLAWFSIARFETLDGLFGIHPLDRGQHLEQRRVSYTAWKRGSSTPELAPPTRLPNPDPRPHISRESARRTADQVFRYAGKSGLVINLDSDFAPTESITLSQLRGWFAGQSKALLSPLVSFFRDRFLSLLHLPFALTSALEALDAQSPTAVAQPPLLPVPDPTLPILIRPLRSRLLKPSHVPLLSSVVPGTKQPVWTLLYSGAQLGFSMRTFDDLIVARCHGPSLLLISGKPVRKETAGTPHSESIVVGAYLPKPWNSTGSPFGNEASRLFEVSPLFEVLPATLQSLDFARYAPSTFGFSFGGTHETARLRMDPEFRYARYAQLPVRQAAPSYAFSRARGGSQVREFSVGFEVLDVEVWGIEGKEIGELEAREASASLGVDKKTAIEAAAAEQEEEEAEIEIDVELMKVLDALPPKGPS